MIDDNYITVLGWMVNRYELKGNELLLYALINGFCQKDNQMFEGSLKYTCEWLSISKKTAISTLKSLTDKGLLHKHEEVRNNITFCYYKTLKPQNVNGGEKITPPVKKSKQGGVKTSPGSGVKITPNNTSINNNSNNNSEQASLFTSIDPKKKSLFKNSAVFDFAVFESQLKDFKVLNVDLNYYYHAVNDWSLSANKMRTASGWIATARNFMRNDKDKGKLKTLDQEDRKEGDNQLFDYLKM